MDGGSKYTWDCMKFMLLACEYHRHSASLIVKVSYMKVSYMKYVSLCNMAFSKISIISRFKWPFLIALVQAFGG